MSEICDPRIVLSAAVEKSNLKNLGLNGIIDYLTLKYEFATILS